MIINFVKNYFLSKYLKYYVIRKNYFLSKYMKYYVIINFKCIYYFKILVIQSWWMQKYWIYSQKKIIMPYKTEIVRKRKPWNQWDASSSFSLLATCKLLNVAVKQYITNCQLGPNLMKVWERVWNSLWEAVSSISKGGDMYDNTSDLFV